MDGDALRGRVQLRDAAADGHAEGIVPFPATGSRKLHARTTFFYGYTGITPAMCMRLTGVGSQYLVAFKDAKGAYLEGDAHYTVTLPPTSRRGGSGP